MARDTVRICVLAAWIACAACAAEAQSVAKKGANVVEVTVGGMGQTKDDAVRDAQRKAVEQGAGTYIASQSKTQDFQLISDTVLAKSAGFLQSWKLLSEKPTADGMVEVKISAVVSIQGIEDTWATAMTLLQRVGHPKIMVFLTEKIDGQVQEDATVQTRIENLLLKNGFDLVNRNQIQAIDKKNLEAAIAEDKPDMIQAIAKRFGAQLFITGSTNASLTERKNPGGVQLFVYGADGDVKSYSSDTAKMFASQNDNGQSADRTQRVAAKKALTALGDTIGPKVQNDILQRWMEAVQGGGEVQLHVEGISAADYFKLKKALGTLTVVKAVNATYSNNIAECSLKAEVTAEQLAEKIVESFPNLEITDISQNVIKAKFKP